MSNEKPFNQIEYVDGYNKENYDRATVRFKKGELQKIKNHAERYNESFNSFITRAAEETMRKDLSENQK